MIIRIATALIVAVSVFTNVAWGVLIDDFNSNNGFARAVTGSNPDADNDAGGLGNHRDLWANLVSGGNATNGIFIQANDSGAGQLDRNHEGALASGEAFIVWDGSNVVGTGGIGSIDYDGLGGENLIVGGETHFRFDVTNSAGDTTVQIRLYENDTGNTGGDYIQYDFVIGNSSNGPVQFALDGSTPGFARTDIGNGASLSDVGAMLLFFTDDGNRSNFSMDQLATVSHAGS